MVIHYRRSLKDWLDILFYIIPGAAAVIFILVMYSHTHFNDWIYWLVAALFAFFAFIKLAEGITRITQPVRSLITIDHKTKMLTAKYPYGRSTKIPFGEISVIQLCGVREAVTLKSGRVRTYCTIEVAGRHGDRQTILLINTVRIFNISARQTEAGLYDTGQQLAKFIAAQTGAGYRWTGYHAAR
jgi:hypothetical protein